MPISAALLTIVAFNARPDAIAVAPGPDGALVVWEQQSRGGQRELHAERVGGPDHKLLDTGGEASEISAVWNGTSWTVAVCSNAWGIDNHDALVVWGDVDEDGAFTKQGERSFGAHGVALACSRMHLERGAPVMWVATRDEHCEAHRLDLAAGQLGKPRPLCRVWAAVGDDAFGIDDAGKPAHVDGLGTVSRTAVTADSDVVGTTVVTRQQATVRRWDAPFKKPPRTMTLGKLPIDTTAPADVIATNDGVVLVQRQRRGDEPMLAVWFDMKGTSHGSSGFGDPGMGQHACAIGDKGLVCAWGDEAAAKIYALTLNPETP